jgi:hypothetical protein
MDTVVPVKLVMNGAEAKTLEQIPPSLGHLLAPITQQNPGLSNLVVLWKEHELKDTNDLIKAYLNNRDDEFVFTVNFEEKIMSYMDTAV